MLISYIPAFSTVTNAVACVSPEAGVFTQPFDARTPLSWLESTAGASAMAATAASHGLVPNILGDSSKLRFRGEDVAGRVDGDTFSHRAIRRARRRMRRNEHRDLAV